MTRFKLISHALVLAGLLVAGGCSREMAVSAQETNLKPVDERNPAPDFTLTDQDGNSVTLSDHKGEVVLLNFWATWCAPCALEIPWFKQFSHQYKDKGLTVLGVATDEGGWDTVRPYLKKAEVNYPILMFTDDVAMLYGGVEALPTTFMIDRDGRIAAVHVGLVSKQEYEDDINALLSTDSADRAGDDRVVVARAD